MNERLNVALLDDPIAATDVPKTVAAMAPRLERDAIDDNVVQHAKLFASSGRVQLYQHGVADEKLPLLEPLAGAADRALNVLEFILERPLDTDALGTPVRIYISPDINNGHVWRGYRHPADPKAIIFLPPQRAADSVRNKNSVEVHEMTHLMTWRYHSHTLREGLADYLAFSVRPGTHYHAPKAKPSGDFSMTKAIESLGAKALGLFGVGHALQTPKPEHVNALANISETSVLAITERLGTTQPPPDNIFGHSFFRSAYYQASYEFVNHFIELGGLDRFLSLYAAENPEALYEPLYGKKREQLVTEALEGVVPLASGGK